MEQEILGVLDLINYIYSLFDFSFELTLSTRPEKFLGELEVWNEAERILEKALNSFGRPWKLNPGDGAFYGPKIDVHLIDALHRRH